MCRDKRSLSCLLNDYFRDTVEDVSEDHEIMLSSFVLVLFVLVAIRLENNTKSLWTKILSGYQF